MNMRLECLHELKLPNQFVNLIKSELIDDTNRLVAYRLRFGGKASSQWLVTLNDQALATIAKHDSKWIHDKWAWKYLTNYSDDTFKLYGPQIMTRDNRKYLDSMLHKLSIKIREAISNRDAEIINLDIDPNQI